MGKRSDFERRERDFYPTPYEAVVPLLPHLPIGTLYDEPCAGDGDLICHLAKHGHNCLFASDIRESYENWLHVREYNALDLSMCAGGMFITNPPWDRKILHPLITHLSDMAPTWLLFDADWMHTRQSAPFMDRLRKVVSVGRVKWIPNSKMTGKDNCCWYLFDKPSNAQTLFYGRAHKGQ